MLLRKLHKKAECPLLNSPIDLMIDKVINNIKLTSLFNTRGAKRGQPAIATQCPTLTSDAWGYCHMHYYIDMTTLDTAFVTTTYVPLYIKQNRVIAQCDSISWHC